MGSPFSSNVRKASCFSAVSPVCGWNQCVKCVTPREMAHSLMTCATTGAMSESSFFPRRMEAASFLYTSFGIFARIWRRPKVFMPNQVLVGSWTPFSSGREVWRGARCAISRRAAMRALWLLAMAGRGIGTGDSAQAVTDFVHGLQKYHRIRPHFQWMTA